MRILKYIFLVNILFSCCYSPLLAQTVQDSLPWYQLQVKEDLPLEEAARNEEALFYSANRQLDSLKIVASQVNILTNVEMKNAGVSNVPEALQLLPEFVVKSKSNGIYHVEYRGTSAVSNYPGTTEHLLLLIDAQPFNDALTGEIWWESLPVTIEDLEHVELIRMPQGTWFGYGGALAIINLVTKQPSQIKDTELTANLKTGFANSHHYHVGLGMRVNDKLSGRIGAYFQRRDRFQNDYYVRSQRNYIVADSVLFYHPEAFRTNPAINLSHQNRGFSVSSSYRWNENVDLSFNAASQNSKAQAPFTLNEELRSITRSSQTQNINARFRSPSLEAQAFYFGGNQDLAKGYAGMQYRLARTGLRANYRKKIGRYSLMAGTEWLSNQYKNSVPVTPLLALSDSLETITSLKENYISIYFQQRAGFLDNRLLLESGQRIYQTYQQRDFPLGYHVSLRWFLTPDISLQASTAQVIQASNRLFGNNRSPFQVRSHNLGFSKQINRKQGNIRLSLFNQEGIPVTQIQNVDLPDYDIPTWGTTVEANYNFGRLSLNANSSWFHNKNDQLQLHPSLNGSLRANYASYFNKLNLYLGVFYNSQHQNIIDGQLYTIPEQLLVNSKLSFQFWKDNQLFINVRNILNSQQYYVPQADADFRLLLMGLNISL